MGGDDARLHERDTPADFAAWVDPELPKMSRRRSLAPIADRDDVVQEALVRAWRKRMARGIPPNITCQGDCWWRSSFHSPFRRT